MEDLENEVIDIDNYNSQNYENFMTNQKFTQFQILYPV